MWDVDVVLTHIGALGLHSNLSDKQLTFKETMLLSFASTGRSFELKALDLRYMVMTDSTAVFELGRSTKSRSKGQKPLKLTFNVDRTIRWCCSLGQTQLLLRLQDTLFTSQRQYFRWRFLTSLADLDPLQLHVFYLQLHVSYRIVFGVLYKIVFNHRKSHLIY